MNTVFFKNLGLVDFKEAWDLQEQLLFSTIEKKRAGLTTNNYLLFCEHPHVYTLGKSGDKKNLLLSDRELGKVGADFYRINRGGDITYHGPGQLVVYPIFDLDNFFTDIHKYLRFLEDVVISVLARFDLVGSRLEGATGVWLGSDEDPLGFRKICAMGVRASRWVTMHGLAFNIDIDLNYFNNIVPCGIANRGVTSLGLELKKPISRAVVEGFFKDSFESVFDIYLTNEK